MDPTQVSEAFGGGVAGVLAVAVVGLAGLLWLTLKARLEDCKADNAELKQDKRDQLGKIDALTKAVDRLAGIVEAIPWEQGGRRGSR